MDTPITQMMLPALSANAMREADRFTIEDLGIPGFTLMESAGRAAVACMQRRFGSLRGKSVACFCGKGNNGGDGLVVARQLAALGANVSIFLMADPDALSSDAGHNYTILQNLVSNDTTTGISFHLVDEVDLHVFAPFDFLVDALLGTGVTRALSDQFRRVVAWMNAQSAPIVALDLPSGIHTDTGEMLGDALAADLTVTMGAMKSGLLMGEGSACTGAVEVAEIGIPEAAIRRAASAFDCAHIVTHDAVQDWLPGRKHTAHKYSVGMALVVAGSPGLTGAATLASTAAARSGAGAVVCATPTSIQDVLSTKLIEVMTLGLPASDAGINSTAALKALEAPLGKASALLIGCGMGQQPETQSFIRTLLSRSDLLQSGLSQSERTLDLPLVLDADGLNAFIDHTDLITAHSKGQWILTPHLGEFKRLAGKDVDLSDRLATVKHYAKLWNCVLILKGAPTVVSDPEGNAYINPIINPALATAGTGDVLAGLCAGFLAQGLTPIKSALTALYLGGEAANLYASRHNPATMLASDLIDHFTQVMDGFKL